MIHMCVCVCGGEGGGGCEGKLTKGFKTPMY